MLIFFIILLDRLVCSSDAISKANPNRLQIHWPRISLLWLYSPATWGLSNDGSESPLAIPSSNSTNQTHPLLAHHAHQPTHSMCAYSAKLILNVQFRHWTSGRHKFYQSILTSQTLTIRFELEAAGLSQAKLWALVCKSQ